MLMKEVVIQKQLSSSALFQDSGMKVHHYPGDVQECLHPLAETYGI